jgi:hypothetical protein
MSVRKLLAGARITLVLVAPVAQPALAEPAEENVYADILTARQPSATLWDMIQGRRPAAREEVRNAVDVPVQTDSAAGAAQPDVPRGNPHMYDYLSGREYQGGA